MFASECFIANSTVILFTNNPAKKKQIQPTHDVGHRRYSFYSHDNGSSKSARWQRILGLFLVVGRLWFDSLVESYRNF